MVDAIKCPVCGETNAADQEFCQYCQSRLQPLTGPLKGADAPLRPGQVPTKKVTAELEPILPQWLREARDKARHSAEEDVSQGMQQEQPPSPGAAEPDLLAGLRSQSRGDDEEETPDWLASITGAPPKSKKAGLGTSEGRRVELGGKNDFAQEAAVPEEGAPSWLAAMQTPQPGDEKDELKDWFRESSGFDEKKDGTASNESAGWMGQQDAGIGTFSKDQGIAADSSVDAPDWLDRISTEGDGKNASAADVPSWLGSDAGGDAQGAGSFAEPGIGGIEAEASSTDDVPGWLQNFESRISAADSQSEDDWLKEHQTKKPDPPLKKHTTPLWLKGIDNSGADAEAADTPVWLADPSSTPTFTPATPPPAIPQPAIQDDEGFGDIPGWLKAAAPQSSIFSEPPTGQAPVVPPEASDWLSRFKSSEPASPEPAEPATSSTDQSQENASLPAFTADAFQDGSADALFTEMPDWLSSASAPASVSSASLPGSSDSIIPGELPSWVQAMRPVDPGVSKPASFSSDETVETRGALSGLQGVLPAVPGYAPSSKPRAYSIKLQATQEQQSHAALLEQILAAEAEPVPITSFSPLRASRGLRWLLSVAVFAVIAGVTLLETRIFSMPVGMPNEFKGALAVAQNIPEGAPVLVAVDYHPARAGEMETAAAPMFDQMILLRHPRLSFVSTNENGPILAERFISGTLSERGYQYGNQYLNLGYLPGGVMGIRAFTQNPPQAMPFDISLDLAWTSAPLQGVSSLSQFAAVIVITDNADSARAWIEQSMPTRGTSPLVIVASAQAAPMLMPYYDSGQVNGIVNGLYGGALFEQNNAGRPGTARIYWDAYSLGMLLAMSLMLGGGFWSLALGLRDRAAAREGK